MKNKNLKTAKNAKTDNSVPLAKKIIEDSDNEGNTNVLCTALMFCSILLSWSLQPFMGHMVRYLNAVYGISKGGAYILKVKRRFETSNKNRVGKKAAGTKKRTHYSRGR
ncbi:2 TM domain-containing transmembrane protein [Acrasis kona]|uniref:2 TM domain-containing transmembrane protein n=1 Tax=Acrasis kona TaxID=1008807 RepID=A0AAW2ZS46_9EUKA